MAEVSRLGAMEAEVWLDGSCGGGLSNREMTVEAARQCAKNRKQWRALVHM